MKYRFLLILLLLALGCKQKKAAITFVNIVSIFEIHKGQSYTATYLYKNTGSDSLKILNASVECGCTQLKYSRNPIAPGMTGKIEVTYNNDKTTDLGPVRKKMLVESNTTPFFTPLFLRGVVLPK